jgi:hypothetical protein
MLNCAADQRFGKEAHRGFVSGGRRKFDRLTPAGGRFILGNGSGTL